MRVESAEKIDKVLGFEFGRLWRIRKNEISSVSLEEEETR